MSQIASNPTPAKRLLYQVFSGQRYSLLATVPLGLSSPVLFLAICLGWTATVSAFQQNISNDKADSVSFGQQLHQARTDFHDRLEQLAQKCDELKLPDQADQARSLIIPRDPLRQYLFLPPVRLKQPRDVTEVQSFFYQNFQRVRVNHAQHLFEIARLAAIDQKDGADVYQLLHEILVVDPEHEATRLALGYRKHHELGWVKTAKQTQATQPNRRLEIVGWDRGTYWKVRSPNFEISSAAGRQAALDLADELERTNLVWRQVFFDYWSSPRQLKQWLYGGKGESTKSRFSNRVIQFRDRAQYLAELSHVPNIAVSKGYYDEGERYSLFYADTNPPVATWRHETIHQLLQQNAGRSRSVANRGHAWLVEAVAMYFESMRVHDHYVTLGGFDAERMQFARLRNKREGFFIPMQELDQLSRKELQARSDIREIYTQSAGVSHFLFTANDAKYRSGYLSFIKDFYRKTNFKRTLAERTLALDQLDRAYQEFLAIDSDQLKNLIPGPQVKALALGRAGLTNDDVALLKECSGLGWLELADNPQVGNEAIQYLKGMKNLTQLLLDGTAVTDECAVQLVEMKSIRELDLAGTRFTDRGVAQLAALPNLEFLGMAGTAVTDACVETLQSMTDLKTVDLRQTQLSDQAIEQLKAQRSDLDVVVNR